MNEDGVRICKEAIYHNADNIGLSYDLEHIHNQADSDRPNLVSFCTLYAITEYWISITLYTNWRMK